MASPKKGAVLGSPKIQGGGSVRRRSGDSRLRDERRGGGEGEVLVGCTFQGL